MSEQAAVQQLKTNTKSAGTGLNFPIQRRCACGQHTVAGGECESCSKKRLQLQRWSQGKAESALLSELPMLSGFAVAALGQPRSGPDFSQVQLRTRQPIIQRQPQGEGTFTPAPIQPTAEVASTPAEAEPTPESPAQETTLAEPTTEPAASGATAVSGLLLEDDAANLGEGQMRKSEFLAELRTAVCAAADAQLAAVGRDTEGCPYLDYWFDYYSQRDAAHGERALRRYAPEAANATSASAYIPFVAARVGQGVARWASTGQISGVPDGIPLALPGLGLLGGIGGLLSGAGRLFFKAGTGAAPEPDDPQAVQAQLGDGRPLDSGVRARMESAFGTGFSHVRLHNDSNAARLSSKQNARAFTVGAHMAFAAGEYQPGTLLGDALIAHELAHVVQQSGAAGPVANMAVRDARYTALERDADETAVNAITSIWGRTQGTLHNVAQNAIPQLRSGLRLQRCATTSQQQQTTPAAPTAATNYGCPPLLENPQWQVAQTPVLRPGNGCSVRLAQSGGGEGMMFTGMVNMGGNCNGSVYFVQYVHPNRTQVYCTPSNRTEALCVTPPWSIDNAWPYPPPHGTNFTMSTSGSGTEQRQARIVDSPGQENISNPSIPRTRICIRDEFVTYLVFEPANGNPMPLAWLEWSYNAQAWRDSGRCPPTSSANDCTGWQVTGRGAKGRESFVPGNMHSSVPLNRSAPVIAPPFGLLNNATDCADTTCPMPSAGGAGAK